MNGTLNKMSLYLSVTLQAAVLSSLLMKAAATISKTIGQNTSRPKPFGLYSQSNTVNLKPFVLIADVPE
jgi:hypothetical protein